MFTVDYVQMMILGAVEYGFYAMKRFEINCSTKRQFILSIDIPLLGRLGGWACVYCVAVWLVESCVRPPSVQP